VALLIAQKVCSALQNAHTAKDSNKKPMDLVHRDVFPQNILLSTSGEVKLVDFGIAKAASKASHTQTGALKGKLLYMSPEQAWGKSIDARTDIFSLGTVLFEMLTGKKLFLGDSEMSILERVREAKVIPPRSVRPEIPEGLERILLKSLQKDPSARYRDCRSMEEDLERFSYQEWTSLPTSYEALEFLSDLFPEVYKKDAIKALKPAETEPETVKMASRPDLAPPKHTEGTPAEEPAPARGGRPPKSQRGKPAPVPPREKPEPPKVEAPPSKREEPKVQEPKRDEPKPAPKPAPPPPKAEEPPKPKAPEPTTPGSSMFGDGADEAEGGGKKKGMVIGIIIAVVIAAIAVIGYFMMGKKGPEPTTNAPGANAPATNAATNAPPPVVMPKPVEPAAGAPAATEAEIKAARGKATDATKAMAKAIADAEQAGASQYAGPSLEALKTSEKTIVATFRKAKNPPEFDAVTQASQQVVAQAGQVKTQSEQAKSAAATAEDTRKAQEAEAAKKKADEEAKKKADDAKKAADTTAAQAAVKKGDFVDSWALDAKPKPEKEIKADYTPMARQNRVQGRVTLEVTVDEGGRATAAQVLKGLSPDYGIHDALVRAALATKFSPGMKDGQPVKTKYIVNLNYTMK
jgi:TonB family protein